MATINYALREISVKIVYYGTGLCGKTTNLQVIHRKVPTEFKSDMVSLATETDNSIPSPARSIIMQPGNLSCGGSTALSSWSIPHPKKYKKT
jgi:GTPase SAR1 family protein